MESESLTLVVTQVAWPSLTHMIKPHGEVGGGGGGGKVGSDGHEQVRSRQELLRHHHLFEESE